MHGKGPRYAKDDGESKGHHGQDSMEKGFERIKGQKAKQRFSLCLAIAKPAGTSGEQVSGAHSGMEWKRTEKWGGAVEVEKPSWAQELKSEPQIVYS